MPAHCSLGCEVQLMKVDLQLLLDLPFKAGWAPPPAPRAATGPLPAPAPSEESDWSHVCTFLPELSCGLGKYWLSQDILPVGSLQCPFRKIHTCPGSRPSWVFLWLGIPFLSLSTWQVLTEFPCVRGDVNKPMKTFSAKSFPLPFSLPCRPDLGTIPLSLNSASVMGPQTQCFLSVFLVENEARFGVSMELG